MGRSVAPETSPAEGRTSGRCSPGRPRRLPGGGQRARGGRGKVGGEVGDREATGLETLAGIFPSYFASFFPFLLASLLLSFPFYFIFFFFLVFIDCFFLSFISLRLSLPFSFSSFSFCFFLSFRSPSLSPSFFPFLFLSRFPRFAIPALRCLSLAL